MLPGLKQFFTRFGSFLFFACNNCVVLSFTCRISTRVLSKSFRKGTHYACGQPGSECLHRSLSRTTKGRLKLVKPHPNERAVFCVAVTDTYATLNLQILLLR